jgi:hypothetical protein
MCTKFKEQTPLPRGDFGTIRGEKVTCGSHYVSSVQKNGKKKNTNGAKCYNYVVCEVRFLNFRGTNSKVIIL